MRVSKLILNPIKKFRYMVSVSDDMVRCERIGHQKSAIMQLFARGGAGFSSS